MESDNPPCPACKKTNAIPIADHDPPPAWAITPDAPPNRPTVVGYLWKCGVAFTHSTPIAEPLKDEGLA